jgi:hypothetical protein
MDVSKLDCRMQTGPNLMIFEVWSRETGVLVYQHQEINGVVTRQVPTDNPDGVGLLFKSVYMSAMAKIQR